MSCPLHHGGHIVNSLPPPICYSFDTLALCFIFHEIRPYPKMRLFTSTAFIALALALQAQAQMGGGFFEQFFQGGGHPGAQHHQGPPQNAPSDSGKYQADFDGGTSVLSLPAASERRGSEIREITA